MCIIKSRIKIANSIGWESFCVMLWRHGKLCRALILVSPKRDSDCGMWWWWKQSNEWKAYYPSSQFDRRVMYVCLNNWKSILMKRPNYPEDANQLDVFPKIIHNLKPIQGNYLLSLEEKYRNINVKNETERIIKSGCLAIDELLGGGLEGGNIIGLSCEGVEGRIVRIPSSTANQKEYNSVQKY